MYYCSTAENLYDGKRSIAKFKYQSTRNRLVTLFVFHPLIGKSLWMWAVLCTLTGCYVCHIPAAVMCINFHLHLNTTLRGSFIFQSPTVEFWPFFFLLNSCTNTFGPLFLTLAVIFQGKGQGQCLLGLCGGRKRGGGIESLAWGIHLSTSVTRNKMSFVTGCFILSQTAEIQRSVQNEILGNVQTKNRKKNV